MTTSFAGPGIAQFLQRLNPLRNNDSDVELNGTEDKGNEPEEGEEEEEQLHYEITEDVPANIKKYYQQRYDLFSRYDEGIQLTHSAWFGVTPEPVANQISSDLLSRLGVLIDTTPTEPNTTTANPKITLIDAFAGAGGNSIAFALSNKFERIFAIDKDPAVLACAKKNAAIYGVANKIVWILGDCFEVLTEGRLQYLRQHEGDRRRASAAGDERVVIFGSPPWGGPSYSGDQVFDLSSMAPYSLDRLWTAFSYFTPDVVLYLPRSSDLNQIAKLRRPSVVSVDKNKKVDVVHYCMHGASKAIGVYFIRPYV